MPVQITTSINLLKNEIMRSWMFYVVFADTQMS